MAERPLTIDEIDTPAVLIDLDRARNNIARAQAHADAAGVALRPHIKTHKLPFFARAQVEAGGRQFVVAREGADGDRVNWDWLRRKAVRFLGSPDIVDRLASLEANAPATALTLQTQ